MLMLWARSIAMNYVKYSQNQNQTNMDGIEYVMLICTFMCILRYIAKFQNVALLMIFMCNHILYQKAIECLNLDKFNHVEIQWLENTNVFSIHSYNKNFRHYFAFMFIMVNEYEHTLYNDPKIEIYAHCRNGPQTNFFAQLLYF